MSIEKGIKKLLIKRGIKRESRKIQDLKKILSEMDKGKKVVLALDVGGKIGTLSYFMPEREWVADDLRESQQSLSEYKSKLRKVI